MDPATLGTAAAGLLAPYLTAAGTAVGTAVSQAAAAQIEAVLAAIKHKFGADADSYAHQTLQRLEEQPAAESRQRALADVVAEQAVTDPAFKAELERLVQAAQANPATAQFVTHVSGGQVGQIVNAQSVGTMTFGQPPAAPDAPRERP